LVQKDAAAENAMATEADKDEPDLEEHVKHGTDNLHTNTTILHRRKEVLDSSEITAGTLMVRRLSGAIPLTRKKDGSTATQSEEDLDVLLEEDEW